MNELLDQNLLDELKEIMEDEFVVLLDTYLAESDKQLDSLKHAWTEQDMDQLGRSAHTLKGSCSNVGAASMAALCMQVEVKARSEDLSGVEHLIQELNVVHCSVSDAIADLRHSC